MLAYSSDLEEETGLPCRAVLMAADFTPRQESAAKRTRDLFLVRYALNDMQFAQRTDTRTIWRAFD